MAPWARLVSLAVAFFLGGASAERIRFNVARNKERQAPPAHSSTEPDAAPRAESSASPTGDEAPTKALPQPPAHYWYQRGGNLKMNSDVPWVAPTDFSKGPAWNWSNPEDEQVRHSPLIDSNSNIYIATVTRIRKFDSRSGTILWTWESPTANEGFMGNNEMVACPVLYGDALLAVVHAPTSVTVYSLSLATGRVNWKQEHAAVQNSDSSAMLAYNDTLVFAVQNWWSPKNQLDGSNRMLLAVDTNDGSHLWDFAIAGVVWNFSPSTPGDGTLLFATSCGVPHRLDFGGQLLWRGPEKDPDTMCSPGGGALGPDGEVFYTSWSHGIDDHVEFPGNFIAAYQVSDGTQLWSKTVVFGNGKGAQYPAVGYIGEDGPLAVVVAVGDLPGVPQPVSEGKTLHNAVIALDAATGKELWVSEEAPWPHAVAAGDDFKDMTRRLLADPHVGPICLPDNQAIPVISGDGTVYAASSSHGHLRAIKTVGVDAGADVGEQRELVATVESTFHPGNAFLNSPSLAPGMLVAAPCFGPTYVFLDERLDSVPGADHV